MSTGAPHPDPSAAEQPPGRAAPEVPLSRDHRRELGRFGEAYAARHLGEAGMVVLDRNWRCDAGEIDLVLRDGAVLVVCEVKTRSSTRFGSPIEGVTPAKAARLRRLAARWLTAHEVHPTDVRIDLVGVLVRPGSSPEVVHVPGVC